MSVVATATTVETGHAHPSVNRPNLTSVGTIIWLSSELMFFAALFAMYFTLRSVTGPDHWKEMASALNFPFSVGDVLPETVSSKTRHGFVILTGSEDAGQAMARADRVRELIKVEVAAGAPAGEVVAR